MKKKLFLYALTALTLSACSTDEDIFSPDVTPAEAEAEEENNEISIDLRTLQSETPIRFGSFDASGFAASRQTTRGLVNAENFNLSNIGVFCAGKSKIDATQNINFSKGSNLSALQKVLSIWQDNVTARMVSDGNGYGRLTWPENDEMHYYPNKKWYSYEFFAYYPKTDTVEYTSWSITPTITVDGNQDVIYATSEEPATTGDAEMDALAFSTYYYRALGTISNAPLPYFNFQHVMARLVFNFKLKEAAPAGFDVHVDSVVIINFPNVVRPRFVKSDVHPSSSYTPFDAYSSGDLYLREQDGSSISGKKDGTDYRYTLSTTKLTVGDAIYIPPVAAGHSRVNPKIKVYLRDNNDGSLYTTVEPMVIAAPATGWESAKEYNINISLSNPVKIQSEARITDFTAVAEEINVSDE